MFPNENRSGATEFFRGISLIADTPKIYIAGSPPPLDTQKSEQLPSLIYIYITTILDSVYLEYNCGKYKWSARRR